MLTATGHTYRLDLGVAGATSPDPSWLTGPVAATYPVDVVSLTALAPDAAEAVVRWRGPPGEVHVGAPVTTHVAGLPLAPGLEPTVTVTGVAEVDLALAPPPAPPAIWMQLAAAAAILAAVVYFTYRIDGSSRP